MLKMTKKIVEEVHVPGAIALEAPLLAAIAGLCTIPGVTPEMVDKMVDKAVDLSEMSGGAPLTVAEHLLPIIADTTPVVMAPAKALCAAFPEPFAFAKATKVPKLPKVF